MAPNYSKILTKNNALVGVGALGAVYLLLTKKQRKSLKLERKKVKKDVEEDLQYTITEKNDNKKIKVQVDRKLFSQLAELLKIVVPGWGSSEAGMFLLIAASLVARSVCDLYMINHGTMIESAIVSMDKALFKQRLFKFLLSLPLIALVNNTLKYAIGDLKIRLRTNLTKRLYEDYLSNFTYYRLTNLDNRIGNPDQLITTDVDKFCEAVTDLYCNTAKPLLDMVIYVYKLSSTMGGSTPAVMLGYLLVSGALLTNLRKPTAKLTSVEQKLEGEFRHINSRLITHSEEVAFYNGNQREKITLLASYRKLQNHLKQFLKFRVIIGVVDNLVAKYFASIIGFIAVSLPFMGGKIAHDSQGERSRLYYTYGRMLVKLAEAIGRLVLAGRDLTRLAGFTSRVTQLRQVISELNAGKYERTMLQCDLIPNSGKVVFQNNIIKFDQVPLVTPNGDVLIKELTFEIKSGMNVLVCGPNGSGKSSLFRILGELWPMFGGQITKPPRGKLFYIPQRPYMTLGSLRDQLTYPHSTSEAKRRGATDASLTQYLTRVNLNYLIEREGGLDAIADWLDVLSGGEKQRIAMARLFYHKPQFAILDECTSAVSVDVEGSMYNYCKEVGITLLTVSHRKSLWQHHEHVLHLDGRGGYQFRKIEEGEDQFGS